MRDEFFDLPEEFRQAREINENFKDEFDYHTLPKTSSKTTLKQRYNKLLKIMKLATSVSLTVAAVSPVIPTIVPIIKIDASESESAKPQKPIIIDELAEELSGVWNVLGYRKVLVVDEKEIISEDNVSDISYSIDIEDGKVYLTYYEKHENLNSSLLEKIDENTYYVHQIKQNGEEIDIYVYLDEVLIVETTIQKEIDGVLATETTYYYCAKEGSDFEFIPSVKGEDLCLNCEGTGFVNCKECEGIGYILCADCNGSGYLDEDCLDCEATGECIYCLGIGNIEETTINEENGEEEVSLIECEHCLGTGICSTCNGSTHKPCDICINEEENSLPGYIECVVCEGSGKLICETCNGTGGLINQEENIDLEQE